MKVFKKCFIIIVFLLVASCVLPAAAVAAPGDFSFTPSISPSKIAPMGGEVKVGFELKNTGSTNITRISMSLKHMGTLIYDTDCSCSTWSGSLAPGASINLSWDVDMDAGYLDKDLTMRVSINNDADPFMDEAQEKLTKLASEDNVFKSSGGQEPEKSVYYVGETVKVTDTMRNSLAIEAAGLSLKYYFKTASHGTKYGDPIALGDVAGGATAEYFFDYTFTDEDIGNFRIGSEITYSVSGKGPYNEFNIAHDFVVEPVPTPTPTPEPTPTPTPEPTPEATPTPSAAEETDTGSGEAESTGTQDDETAAAPTEAAETEEDGEASASPNWLTIIIIALVVMLVAAVIVLVAVTAKKSKAGDDFI